jgi:Tetracyclin repressor-like, C-terminal domain
MSSPCGGAPRRWWKTSSAAGTCDVADIPAVARALLSLCIDIARWYQPDHGSTPEQVGDLYAELALRMVGARPAHRDGVSAH